MGMVKDGHALGFHNYRGDFNLILRAAMRLEPDRTGGCFCAADVTTGVPIALGICGEVLEEKHPKYVAFAQEKPRRLATHPDHLTSQESSDSAKEMYPGAIRTPEYLLAFSGFSGEMDEAMMIEYALMRHMITYGEAEEIARRSRNGKWQTLRQEILNLKSAVPSRDPI